MAKIVPSERLRRELDEVLAGLGEHDDRAHRRTSYSRSRNTPAMEPDVEKVLTSYRTWAIVGCSPNPDRDSQLVKFVYTASLSGEYRNIRRFIHELEKAPEFLVLENVALSQSDVEERGLNVTMQIATYYRTGVNGN